MAPRPPRTTAGFHPWRIALWTNLVAGILLAVALVAMVNYLSGRHYARFHWQRSLFAQLSKRSLRLLESVSSGIRVVVLLRPTHAAYASTTELLREYAARTPNLTLEFVDPDRDMARTEQLVRQYRLDGGECLVFEIGGRRQTVPADALVETVAPLAETDAPRRTFRGEQLFTSAIYALTQAARPAVFFTQGHGERSPVDFDRRTGYSRIATRLRDENLDVELLHLGEAQAVPNRCALLVVAGPAREFAPFEIAMVRDYLDRKGRLLLLLDARVKTGLEPLLQEWGALVGDDVVLDDSRTLSGRELYVTGSPNHPITAPLQDLDAVLFLPRSIRPRPADGSADKPAFAALAACSAKGWAEFDPDDATVDFDRGVDIAGPVPVAVAIERGPVPGVRVQIRPTRLVVIGDSDFAANGGLMGANADLFLKSANWLLEREALIDLTPTTLADMRLVMNARQLRALFASVVLGLPGLAAALGLGVALLRRKRP